VEEEWAAAGKSSSARVNVRWTGVRFGSEFSLSDTEVEWIVSNCYDCALPSSTLVSPSDGFSPGWPADE